jgi:hypothetical protein
VLLEAQPGQQVDHIDGDPLNNRRANLRLVTGSQNQQNRRRAANNSSGRKGVTWHQRDGRWQVRIQLAGQRIHLGYYQHLEWASSVYDAAAMCLFGEYACLNSPGRPPLPIFLRIAVHRLKRGMAGGGG